ncbi:hypothetical protein M1O57_04545 [Dehalococcoidia bacterium]|nr:hypothetical protein [Dehalococcoidia bacterium]
MSYRNETEMYPDVIEWLGAFLGGRLRGAAIDVRDTHLGPLNEYVQRHGLQKYFEDDAWQTYEIRVDVTAFTNRRGKPGLVFVECKVVPISLTHVSQLLGYSRVARPLLSYLISTAGIGDSVKALLLRYDRTDILHYYWEKGKQPRSIIVAKWDEQSKNIEASSILPPGTSTV